MQRAETMRRWWRAFALMEQARVPHDGNFDNFTWDQKVALQKISGKYVNWSNDGAFGRARYFYERLQKDTARPLDS